MTEPRLDSLPQELIDQIASETVVRYDFDLNPCLQDQLEDLANLSRTCKRLHEACTPILFRQITLFQLGFDRALYFLQGLTISPHLGSYVRVFKARDWLQACKQVWQSNEVAQGFLESDPEARLVLDEDPSSFWDIVTACTLKLLPDLGALTTAPAVMQIAARWPEEQRLQGSSISVMYLIHAHDECSDHYCEDMFGWKQAFRPEGMPFALHFLHLDHRGCQTPALRGNQIHREPDVDSLRIASSLRRLQLFAWLPSEEDESDCVARLIGTLDKCTSLIHLTFMEEADASLKTAVGFISSSTVLTANLQTLEFRMKWANDSLDADTLSQLSRFTQVTRLTLPWINIDIDGDTSLDGMVWPPCLVSLTLYVGVFLDIHATSLLTITKAEQFPAAMQNITLSWFVMEDDDTDLVPGILDLIDLSQAWHQEFAPSGIALLHEHPRPDDPDGLGAILTSTNIEHAFLLPMLLRGLEDADDLSDEEQLRVDAILERAASSLLPEAPTPSTGSVSSPQHLSAMHALSPQSSSDP